MGRKKEEIVIEESDYVIHSKERAMNRSIAEGSSFSVASSFSNSFITPFALAIGANNFHIGLLSSLSGLVAPLGEVFGSRLMEKHSRKTIMLRGKLLQIFVWFAILGIIYLAWKGFLEIYLPYLLIVFYVLAGFVGGNIYPAWFSWMGDIIPAQERGRYFAKRNRFVGLVGILAFIVGAFILDYFQTNGLVLVGFAIIFGVSIIFREVSRKLIKRIFNPRFKVRKGYYFTFFDFVKRYDNFGKFAFYQAFMFFAVMISAPFFAVYMIEDLGFSYVAFTSVVLSSTVFYLAFAPLAGKFSDKYGNVKLLYVAGFLFPFVPLLWIFFESPIYLILLPGLVSGLANAAFNLGVVNFVYDAVPQQKRGLCIAYNSLLVGIGVFAGSLVGGIILQYLPITFMSPIFFVFMLSTVLMIAVGLFFLPQIKDERKTEKVQGLSVDFLHPFKTIQGNLVWFKNFIHEK